LKIQSIPTLGTPTLRNSAALENQVFVATPRQRAAQAQAGLSGAYDHRPHIFHENLYPVFPDRSRRM